MKGLREEHSFCAVDSTVRVGKGIVELEAAWWDMRGNLKFS